MPELTVQCQDKQVRRVRDVALPRRPLAGRADCSAIVQRRVTAVTRRGASFLLHGFQSGRHCSHISDEGGPYRPLSEQRWPGMMKAELTRPFVQAEAARQGTV